MIVKEYMPLKAGFTLIEIAIGLVILGLAGSVAIPAFQKQMIKYERQSTLATLDSIVAQAWLNTLTSGKIHRFKANLKAGTIAIEVQKQTDGGEMVYEKVPFYFSDKDFVLPKNYEITQFYIDGVDECAQHGAGRTMEDVWFFIYPQGYTQAVVINMINNASNNEEIGLVLNPFRMQFEVHDAFQKP